MIRVIDHGRRIDMNRSNGSRGQDSNRACRGGYRLSALAAVCSLVACGGAEQRADAAVGADASTARQAALHSHPDLQAHAAAGERRRTLAAARALPSADLLFDWAERTYPQYFPSHRTSQTAAPYTYRFYPETGNYLGLDGETVAVLGPISGQQVMTVGLRSDFACQVLPMACGPTSAISRVAAGVGYSLAVRADGSVLQWGELALTTAGSVVPGTTAIKLDGLSNIVGVKASQASAALDASGVVHSWGSNYYGALGYTPQGIADNVLQPRPNPLIGNAKDVVIDGSGYDMMTVFVRLDGTVGYTPRTLSFGPVGAGQVAGLSGVESLSVSKGPDSAGTRAHAVKSDGTVWALNWQENLVGGGRQYQLVAAQVRGLPAIAQLACAYRYCLAAAKDGSVWAWGDGSHGALGDGTGFSRDQPVKALGLTHVERVVAGNFASHAITKDGALYIWGAQGGGAVSQEYFRTHADDFLRPQLFIESRFGVVDLATSGNHVILLLKDGSVWGWGDNSAGQVGDGTRNTYDGRIVQVLGVNLN